MLNKLYKNKDSLKYIFFSKCFFFFILELKGKLQPFLWRAETVRGVRVSNVLYTDTGLHVLFTFLSHTENYSST